ncbi:copper amine oxidase [Lentibacillus sediminis]|uniref:copper amine oxidase n=1 Tax=Lentibacillus sediminis TaxID=1940529 RepID=UPI000C1BBF61|nr:copper amine oxidase [Lentibacillus sediminis]
MKRKHAGKKLLAVVMSFALFFPLAQPVLANEESSADTPAAELRSNLDHLLSEHFVLAAISMMTAYDEAGSAESVREQLEQNAQDMTPAIASIYGEENAAEFERIFTEHNTYTDDIVTAAQEDDAAMREEAEAQLDAFVDELAAFLTTATEGNLPEEAAAEAIMLHEEQVLMFFDHYVAGEYQEAYQAFRDGIAHMHMVSKALSTAITTQMPEEFDHTRADTPAADLRSNLNQLAAEHFALGSLGMLKGSTQSADYDFITWAEDQNTKDFKAAIASIYGEEPAAAFQEVWQTDHISAEADLVTATLEEDEEGIQEAKDRLLSTFPADMGAFLAFATDGIISEEAAVESLMTHEQQKIDTFDAYVAGDFQASFKTFREGYEFMYGVGKTLSGAIVTQMPGEFQGEVTMPEEMPKTGLGGMSETSNVPMMTWAVVGSFIFVAGASLFLIYRKTHERE